MTKDILKQSLKIEYKLEPFFTCLSLQFSQDEQHILCVANNVINVIALSNGKILQTIVNSNVDSEDEIVRFITAKNKDFNLLYVAYRSGLLREFIWNLETVELKRSWKSLHSSSISCMVYNEHETLLASGASDSLVKIWDTSKHYCTHYFKECVGVITAMAFQNHSNPGQAMFFLASGDRDNIINVWDLRKSSLIGKLKAHTSTVVGIHFFNCSENQDKNLVLSGSRDKIAVVWSLKDFTIVRSIPIFESIESIVLVPENVELAFIKKPVGRVFFTGGEKGVIKAWDTKSGCELFRQTNSILVLNDGKDSQTQLIDQIVLTKDYFVVTSFEKNILFYDLKNFILKKQFIGHIDEVSDIKFLGHNQDYLLVSSNSPILKIFNIETLSCILIKGHTDLVLNVQVFPTNPLLFATSSKDNSVRIWKFNPEIIDASCIFVGEGHSLSVTCIAVPQTTNRWLFSGSQDCTMKVWKVPKIKSEIKVLSTLETVKAHDKDINYIAISPNDRYLCSCSQDKLAKLWRFDKKLIEVGTLKGHKRGIWCVTFSPIDLILATSSGDATIKIWSLTDTSCLKTLQGHECSVLKIIFINKGRQIISSSSDGNIKIWNLKSNECINTFDAHEDKIWALEVDREEKLIVSGGDSRIVIWRDDTEEQIEEKEKKLADLVEAKQKLSNFMRAKNWKKALKMAILLDDSVQGIIVLRKMLLENELDLINNLRDEQLSVLIKWSIKWNSNSKQCEVAQCLINHMLRLGINRMMNLVGKQDVLSLIPFTERHFKRAEKLNQQIALVDLLWSNMKIS